MSVLTWIALIFGACAVIVFFAARAASKAADELEALLVRGERGRHAK